MKNIYPIHGKISKDTFKIILKALQEKTLLKKTMKLSTASKSIKNRSRHLERKGLGLGRNLPYILDIDTEREENYNDLFTFIEFGKKNQHP